VIRTSIGGVPYFFAFNDAAQDKPPRHGETKRNRDCCPCLAHNREGSRMNRTMKTNIIRMGLIAIGLLVLLAAGDGAVL